MIVRACVKSKPESWFSLYTDPSSLATSCSLNCNLWQHECCALAVLYLRTLQRDVSLQENIYMYVLAKII